MIKDSDIVFVTTTLYTKWLIYQQKIIKNLFPDSQVIIIDGRENWPNSWFYWIDSIKKSKCKYYIHIDEDFFITSKDELLAAVQKIEDNKADLIGCPDGYHQFRSANPVAINTFLMIGRTDDIKKLKIDLKSLKYQIVTKDGGRTYSWINDIGIRFKSEYKNDFEYNFRHQGGSNFENDYEPYYAFMWSMKELKCKFDYLYPFFDDRFKSTNPRLCEDSKDIGIHMWYTRGWDSQMDVWGISNIERYKKVESFLNDKKNPLV